jgi:hypothetical protein
MIRKSNAFSATFLGVLLATLFALHAMANAMDTNTTCASTGQNGALCLVGP